MRKPIQVMKNLLREDRKMLKQVFRNYKVNQFTYRPKDIFDFQVFKFDTHFQILKNSARALSAYGRLMGVKIIKK